MLHTVPWASDLQATVDAHADRIAVHDGERSISFREMAGRAARVAHVLRERGVQPGTPVATSLRNSIAAVWVSVGLRLAGAAETALSAGYTEPERRHAVGLSGARLVVTSDSQAAAFRDLGCEVVTAEEIPEAPGDLAALPPVPGDAWGRIGFTSGTTGAPKAIITTHAARFIGNLLQRASWNDMPGPGSRILLMTPFVHGAGLLTHAFNDCGATAVLLNGVDIPRITQLLDEGDLTHIFAPPTVLAKLVATFEGRRIVGVRTVFCGTAPLTASLYAKARALFGPVIRLTYGKSEINNPITALSPAECDAYYAQETHSEGVCVGFPGTGVEVLVRDDYGSRCDTDSVGEVHLRGRHMSIGHVDTTGFHPLPPDGFHATGDLGRIDALGRLHLVGRMADVIKSGGYKIHPDEIERVLAGTAGAAAVAVVSLPSEYWGEVIVAVAETDDAGWPDRACAALTALSRHKHPRALLTMPELPRNPQGKVMRRLIRAAVLERYTLIDGPHPKLLPNGRG